MILKIMLDVKNTIKSVGLSDIILAPEEKNLNYWSVGPNRNEYLDNCISLYKTYLHITRDMKLEASNSGTWSGECSQQ